MVKHMKHNLWLQSDKRRQNKLAFTNNLSPRFHSINASDVDAHDILNSKTEIRRNSSDLLRWEMSWHYAQRLNLE